MWLNATKSGSSFRWNPTNRWVSNDQWMPGAGRSCPDSKCGIIASGPGLQTRSHDYDAAPLCMVNLKDPWDRQKVWNRINELNYDERAPIADILLKAVNGNSSSSGPSGGGSTATANECEKEKQRLTKENQEMKQENARLKKRVDELEKEKAMLWY